MDDLSEALQSAMAQTQAAQNRILQAALKGSISREAAHHCAHLLRDAADRLEQAARV